MTNHTTWDLSTLKSLIQQHQATPGGLLPLLHAIQDSFGYIPADAVPLVAKGLRQTRAEIHGVISFYHHFRTSPPGQHVVKICRAEACQARGARELEQHVKQSLGIDFHNTTLDGDFTLEPVYCLGNCACGPTIQVNDEITGRVTNDSFDQIIETLTTLAVEIK